MAIINPLKQKNKLIKVRITLKKILIPKIFKYNYLRFLASKQIENICKKF